MSAPLPEEKVEALAEALDLSPLQCTCGRDSHDFCGVCIAGYVAPLVAGWLAEAWDEGYRDEGPRAHDPGYAERANPYRGGDA